MSAVVVVPLVVGVMIGAVTALLARRQGEDWRMTACWAVVLGAAAFGLALTVASLLSASVLSRG